ncbi:AP-3 complex subunit delta-1 [Saguinus oedipus]|uniref:AP-3 complex subunit delta-1 n=1 Tax=Saguinus oedipus TaxID=9490 RepID=A0ABQ9TQ75_SAGOE|nr:AP-3 complex subunit delta-1 [Saguinus oedipus]
MAQKLKGTLSFIAKVCRAPLGVGEAALCAAFAPLQNDEGATQEKLDFRLHFSCSSYLITTPCYRWGPATATAPPLPPPPLRLCPGV